jgi:simple sugar transport system permease protein
MSQAVADKTALTAAPTTRGDFEVRLRRGAETVAVPLVALGAAAALFSVFLLLLGKSPVDFFALVAQGAFASWFSLQNTLQRAAPLLFTALCCAIPARLGLVVIGAEGALALGGLAAAAAGIATASAPSVAVLLVMATAGIVVGGSWIALVGALRHWRGINETISSLILNYIAIALMNHFVEGPLKDPASLNKPSTQAIPEGAMIGAIPGTDVHWGLVIGIVLCVVLWVLMSRTTFGFATRIVGGNLRAAQLQGLAVGPLILIACAIAGAAAGLAGMIEVAAVNGRANASLVVGYGYTGVLVAFLARHNPLAVVPIAILFGGIVASGGLIQRRMGLPDATILVLQGIVFVAILASDTLYGRWRIFQPRSAA